METSIGRPRRGVSSNGLAERYRATCTEGHRFEVDLDQLRELLEHDCCPVADAVGSECGACVEDVEPEQVLLQCQFCDHREVFNWRDIDFSCDQCPGGPVEGAMQVGGASSTRASLASDLYEVEIETGWRRERPDHWECLTHFTTAQAFATILQEGRIRAKHTGYFGLPAVCLTEVPVEWAQDFSGRFGEFGLVFFKTSILQVGGAPTINLPPRLISPEMPGGLRPFVNKIDASFNFLHEREWRAPSDLDFDRTPPMLLLPEGFMGALGELMAPEAITSACQRFGVLQYSIDQPGGA